LTEYLSQNAGKKSVNQIEEKMLYSEYAETSSILFTFASSRVYVGCVLSRSENSIIFRRIFGIHDAIGSLREILGKSELIHETISGLKRRDSRNLDELVSN